MRTDALVSPGRALSILMIVLLSFGITAPAHADANSATDTAVKEVTPSLPIQLPDLTKKENVSSATPHQKTTCS